MSVCAVKLCISVHGILCVIELLLYFSDNGHDRNGNHYDMYVATVCS